MNEIGRIEWFPAWKSWLRFYDEREWRYVPVVRGVAPSFLDWEEYSNTSKTNALHSQLRKRYALKFTPDDIQYLIVPYEKDEKNIIELHNYLAGFYSRRDAILVTSAILTDNCIHQDI